MKTTRDVMQPRPIVITEDESLHRALELLIANNISGLPVVDGAGRLVGVLTEKDLLKIFYEPDAHTVESVMTRSPISISVDAPLVDVVDCLMANDFRRVFIHDHETLVGLVSRADLMPAILSALLERS
ncbi:MAG: CBS domain-containing protein [Deltaproteobacteria bacterium]|nr:CBS domain-containing protein [Deltaproteobacteria bacterium]MBW2359365.1 CBS domain-containing protein [Deltaproteobacteria bacterium]